MSSSTPKPNPSSDVPVDLKALQIRQEKLERRLVDFLAKVPKHTIKETDALVTEMVSFIATLKLVYRLNKDGQVNMYQALTAAGRRGDISALHIQALTLARNAHKPGDGAADSVMKANWESLRQISELLYSVPSIFYNNCLPSPPIYSYTSATCLS